MIFQPAMLGYRRVPLFWMKMFHFGWTGFETTEGTEVSQVLPFLKIVGQGWMQRCVFLYLPGSLVKIREDIKKHMIVYLAVVCTALVLLNYSHLISFQDVFCSVW